MLKKIDLVPVLSQDNKVKTYITLDSDINFPYKISKVKIKNPVIIMAGGKGTRLDPFASVAETTHSNWRTDNDRRY